jgi:hypothetical protein
MMTTAPLELEGRALPICPYGADKRPTCKGGFNSASADSKVIEQLWRRYPGPLIGVRTGAASGLAVLDIDPKHDGEAWLAEFEATQITRGAPSPFSTRVHATRSGGLHFIFQQRPGLKSNRDLIARGVDVRADRGAVIWWPSAGYRVLSEGPVAPWPAILDQALAEGDRRRRRKAAENHARYERVGKKGEGAPLVAQNGYRTVPKPLHEKLCKLMPGGHDQRRVRGILSVVTEKVGTELGGEDEGRNDAIYWAGRRFRELIADAVITLDVAEELLMEAARINGYVLKDGEGETIDTIHSGLGVVNGHEGCTFSH